MMLMLIEKQCWKRLVRCENKGGSLRVPGEIIFTIYANIFCQES